MCAVPGTSKRISVTMLIGVPPIACASLARELVRLRNERRNPTPVAAQHPAERPEPGTTQAHIDVAVERLHAEQDDGFPRPAERVQDAYGPPGMPQQRTHQVPEPERDASPAGLAARQDGGQQPHRIGPGRIARGLDVRVLVQVEARADRDALRQVLACRAHARRSATRNWCARGCPTAR